MPVFPWNERILPVESKLLRGVKQVGTAFFNVPTHQTHFCSMLDAKPLTSEQQELLEASQSSRQSLSSSQLAFLSGPLVLVPVLLFCRYLQNHMIDGLTAGGVKG